YVNPQERKPQAQRDWLDLLQGRAHNVHEVDVCALSLLCKSPRAQAAGAAGIDFLDFRKRGEDFPLTIEK
ncbi:hypothetical protein, partial [Selenomonas bovis]|uniref:hypothetical protein n=1 Tax=Selenomonas bovis TaxID=416586 RepID=UPI003AB9303B